MRFIHPASVLNPKQADKFFADEAYSAGCPGGDGPTRCSSRTSTICRLWWVDGTCRAVRNHPQSAPGAVDEAGLDEFIDTLDPRIAELGVAFVTTDVTLDEKGRWGLVEVGSGSVGELPAGLGVDDLFPDTDG